MTKKWIMKQHWSQLLFLHYPVKASELRKYIPSDFEIDEYEGTAYISIVPFKMSKVELKGLAFSPYKPSLFELNVRTYVKYRGLRSVYFFSLDATSPLSVWIARQFFHLNYLHAHIQMKQKNDSYQFYANRTHPGEEKVEFSCDILPFGEELETEKGSLEEFLTERYYLVTHHKNKIFLGNISHDRWKLKNAQVEIHQNTLLKGFSFENTVLSTEPIIQFASPMDVKIISYSTYKR